MLSVCATGSVHGKEIELAAVEEGVAPDPAEYDACAVALEEELNPACQRGNRAVVRYASMCSNLGNKSPKRTISSCLMPLGVVHPVHGDRVHL